MSPWTLFNISKRFFEILHLQNISRVNKTLDKALRIGYTISMDETARLYEHIIKSVREYEAKMEDKRGAREKMISERLRTYIAKTGITKEALARELDVSRMQLFRWLEKGSIPGEEMMKKLEDKGIIDKI